MIKVKCPICGNTYINHEAVYSHIDRVHSEDLPKGMPADQYFYELTHNGKKGHCVICHKETPWNERTHKYHRLCGRKECDEAIRKQFQERMMRVRGTDNLAIDPNHQRKMLAGRSISGVYTWPDGNKTNYVGTYEKDFLRICDDILDLKSTDVVDSPNTYHYKFEGQDHFYIPDFYLPELNLEVEIKDGGNNPNMHHKIQDVDKKKEKMKDFVMLQQHDHHYIKITNKDYGDFIKLINYLSSGDITKREEINKIKILGK